MRCQGLWRHGANELEVNSRLGVATSWMKVISCTDSAV